MNMDQELLASAVKLVTAESCTGGLLAAIITEIPGASGCFERGFVTYSNEAKTELLAVKPKTLATHGAVSENTAREMAEGALQKSHAQISMAITGIAGPEGGSDAKPVGTVCFGWQYKHQASLTQPTQGMTWHFAGNRAQIRQQAVSFALQKLITIGKTQQG
jgi:nicotinamide-nucleotide amidase